MVTTSIKIDDSKELRIPNPLIEKSGLGNTVEVKVKKGEIKIVAAGKKRRKISDTFLLSEKALSDWNRPEEDEAWESLQ